jgi:hypothetical protein
MADNNENRGRSRRLGVEERGWPGTSWILGGRTIGGSGYAMCDPHRTRGGDKKRGFSGLASKLVATICLWFGHITTTTISWFWPQNQDWRFDVLALKITTTVPWSGPQNQVGRGLSVCASKPSGKRFVGLRLKTDDRMKMVGRHASTSSSLLHREASQARVF